MNSNDGYCECGCGELAPIANRTRSNRDQVKGFPIRFIYNHQNIGKPCSDETRKKISISNKGKIRSEEALLNNSLGQLGKKMSLESRIKNSLAHKGNKTHLWRGGITPQNRSDRNTLEQKQWIKDVFERDNYTCQNPECNQHGGKLHAHHIKSFSKFKELRTVLSNGITWCEKCHFEWHKENGYR